MKHFISLSRSLNCPSSFFCMFQNYIQSCGVSSTNVPLDPERNNSPTSRALKSLIAFSRAVRPSTFRKSELQFSLSKPKAIAEQFEHPVNQHGILLLARTKLVCQ